MKHGVWMAALTVSVVLSSPQSSSASIIIFEVGGNASTASIQGTVDAFRTALGNPNNGNAPGTTGGRREINWDGGGATATAPGGTPFTVFFDTRGALVTTPGTGFVQVPVTDNNANGLSDIADFYMNPAYNGEFGAFSPVRVFNPVGSNITDVTFIVPGTAADPISATVSGFGSVFSDVDAATSTQMMFFDILGNILFSRFVPAGSVPNGSLSFLGGFGNAGEQIARVRLITGNAALGAGTTEGGAIDLAVMDDFLYSEPQAVPEPMTLGLVAVGFGAAASRARRRRLDKHVERPSWSVTRRTRTARRAPLSGCQTPRAWCRAVTAASRDRLPQ
jgi:hypothetical protein